jgi:hypothetical protein
MQAVRMDVYVLFFGREYHVGFSIIADEYIFDEGDLIVGRDVEGVGAGNMQVLPVVVYFSTHDHGKPLRLVLVKEAVRALFYEFPPDVADGLRFENSANLTLELLDREYRAHRCSPDT